MNVAIIPARGGSRRIPGKNIRLFAGAPMISYSIRAALEAQVFDRVIVSTDSDDIAGLAKQYGAEVPFQRPPELADDLTGTDAVISHALEALRTDGVVPELTCCIYATAPFLDARYLIQGRNRLVKSDRDNALAVTSFAFPIWRGHRITDEGDLEMQWPEHRMSRSQDLPEMFHDAGQFCWTRTDRYLAHPDFYRNALPVILPRHLVQDIDTEEDWRRAELMYKAMHA